MIQLHTLSPTLGKIHRRPLVFLDVETTGLDPAIHEIVQVALIREAPDGTVEEELTRFVAPVRRDVVSPWVHDNVEIRWDAPAWSEVEEDVLRLLDGAVMVGHNIRFDLGFLEAAVGVTRMPSYHALDTATLAYSRMPALDSLSLGAVAGALQVEQGAPHSALDDARTARQVFHRLCAA